VKEIVMPEGNDAAREADRYRREPVIAPAKGRRASYLFVDCVARAGGSHGLSVVT